MTMVQLTSLTEDELSLLLYILNVKFPHKYEITRDMLLSYNVGYIVEYLHRVANDIKDEHKQLLEHLYFKVTHEAEHVIELPVIPTETTSSVINENSPIN